MNQQCINLSGNAQHQLLPKTVTKLAQLLQKQQAAKATTQAVQTQTGIIVGGGIALKGKGRAGGKKTGRRQGAQKIVVGEPAPWLLYEPGGKGPVHGIGMGQTAVADAGYRQSPELVAAFDQAAKEKGVPLRCLQKSGHLRESICRKAPEQHIVLKNQNPLRTGLLSSLQTQEVGFVNTLLRVRGLVGHHELTVDE